MDERLRFDTAPPGLAPGPGYSHVATGTGRLVFVAGQVALDERGDLVGAADASEQAEQVFRNLGAALQSAGTSFSEVVKLTYFVTDIRCLPAVRQVRDRYLNTANPPTSTAVQVQALARPEFLIEVEAVALAGD